MTSNKTLLPVALGAFFGLGALVAAALFLFELMNLSYHTYGTPFSKYSTEYSTQKTDPRDTFLCDPAYHTRWSACNVK